MGLKISSPGVRGGGYERLLICDGMPRSELGPLHVKELTMIQVSSIRFCSVILIFFKNSGYELFIKINLSGLFCVGGIYLITMVLFVVMFKWVVKVIQ